MAEPHSLTIRPLEALAEYQAVEDLSRAAWNLPDHREVVPAHLMMTFQHNGGLVLGAYAGDQLVGFSLGFIGLTADGRVKLCSEQLGVLPAYQNQQVGYRLKLAQREQMLARGIDLITWTYDPLETRNARLNLHKLGAVCNTYLMNAYGDIQGINAGLPSDRFQVDWWLDSARVGQRLAQNTPCTLAALRAAGVPVLGPGQTGPFPPPPDGVPALYGRQQLACVPANMQALKQADMALAHAWRQYSRALFTTAFSAGYAATDLFFTPEGCYYLLERIED